MGRDGEMRWVVDEGERLVVDVIWDEEKRKGGRHIVHYILFVNGGGAALTLVNVDRLGKMRWRRACRLPLLVRLS